MRKKLGFFICLAVFLQTIAFAQMQGLISYSSERYSRNIQPKSKTVKVEVYDEKNIITLCRDNSSTTATSYFCKTILNSSVSDYGTMFPGVDVFDFKIYNEEYIIMCGQYSGDGFIGKIKISDLFAGVGQLEYYSVPVVSVLYKIDYYLDHEHLKVATLGHDGLSYYFVDYDLSDISIPYYYYKTDYTLYDLTQTQNYISIVFSKPVLHEFGIMRHDKTNIFNCQSQMWAFAGGAAFEYTCGARKPEKQDPCYLIENVDNSNDVFVAVALQDHPYESTGHSIVVYDIKVSSWFLSFTQIIQTAGKPKLKDMEYCPIDNSLNIVSNVNIDNNTNNYPISNGYSGRSDIDVIHKLRRYVTGNIELIVPSNSADMDDCLNSIAKYRDNYYIVAGKYKNTGSLYWFDREHTLQNNNGGCYEIYSAPVYWCSTQPSTTMTYYPSSDVKILNIIPCTASSTPLFIPCSD